MGCARKLRSDSFKVSKRHQQGRRALVCQPDKQGSIRAYRVVTHRCVHGHYRLAQGRSETHFSEVLRRGFALVNRVTPRMSHLREVHWARGVVCDNPIGTL